MAYEWDNKKPTAQMLGRWQPFHDGHYALFQEVVKKNIKDKLNPEFEGRFKVMMVPNITNICYGRGVGYKIEEVVLSEEIQQISATKIRAKMREDGKLK
jgi:hypothetical protein